MGWLGPDLLADDWLTEGRWSPTGRDEALRRVLSEPGRSLNLSGRGAPAGKVVVFYWWYKGDEIQPGSGIHGPDRVRRVLLQVPGAPTDRDRAKP